MPSKPFDDLFFTFMRSNLHISLRQLNFDHYQTSHWHRVGLGVCLKGEYECGRQAASFAIMLAASVPLD